MDLNYAPPSYPEHRTLTMFGRVSEWTRLESKLDAVLVEVTNALCPAREGPAQRGH